MTDRPDFSPERFKWDTLTGSKLLNVGQASIIANQIFDEWLQRQLRVFGGGEGDGWGLTRHKASDHLTVTSNFRDSTHQGYLVCVEPVKPKDYSKCRDLIKKWLDDDDNDPSFDEYYEKLLKYINDIRALKECGHRPPEVFYTNEAKCVNCGCELEPTGWREKK